MRARLRIMVLLLVALLPPTLAPGTAGADHPWPPLKAHLSAQVEGWNVTFLITLENLTDRPLEGITIKAVPARFIREATRLVDSWAGSPGQNPGDFDGVAVGWVHDEVAPRSREGPFAFTLNFERSYLATFNAYAWISWTGPVPGAFTSEELAVTPPPPELLARPIAVKRFWISSGWNTPPQALFSDIQGISYDVELEDLQSGDLIEFRVYDQATSQLVATSGQRLSPGGPSFPPGSRALSGGGIKQLPLGVYRAEVYVNGRRQAEVIPFQVAPYTGPPSICHGYGNVDVTLDLTLAKAATKAAAEAGARGSHFVGPGEAPDSVKIQFAVEPEVGPEANPRDKAMAETERMERIMEAIKDRLASLGIPKEDMHSLQTAPDCRLMGPSPRPPPTPAAPGA